MTEHSLSKHIIDSHENLWRHRICGPTPDTNIDLIIPLCCCHGRVINVCQDSKHGAKTAHNQLLTGAQLLSLGHFTALYTYLRDIAVATLGPLFRRDVGNVDKQDDRAASRTLSSATIGFIGQFFPQRRGLSVYLFVLGELVDAWQNCAISHLEHAHMVMRARLFLTSWHSHITRHPDHSTSTHFISHESYKIFIIMCDSLLSLILSHL